MGISFCTWVSRYLGKNAAKEVMMMPSDAKKIRTRTKTFNLSNLSMSPGNFLTCSHIWISIFVDSGWVESLCCWSDESGSDIFLESQEFPPKYITDKTKQVTEDKTNAIHHAPSHWSSRIGRLAREDCLSISASTRSSCPPTAYPSAGPTTNRAVHNEIKPGESFMMALRYAAPIGKKQEDPAPWRKLPIKKSAPYKKFSVMTKPLGSEPSMQMLLMLRVLSVFLAIGALMKWGRQ